MSLEHQYPAYYRKILLDSYKNVFGWRRWFLGCYWVALMDGSRPEPPKVEPRPAIEPEYDEDGPLFILAIRPARGQEDSFKESLSLFLESQGIVMEYQEVESDR